MWILGFRFTRGAREEEEGHKETLIVFATKAFGIARCLARSALLEAEYLDRYLDGIRTIKRTSLHYHSSVSSACPVFAARPSLLIDRMNTSVVSMLHDYYTSISSSIFTPQQELQQRYGRLPRDARTAASSAARTSSVLSASSSQCSGA